MKIMSGRFTIVGLGEALFDIFPDAAILGGAPLNVAVHAQQLGASRGGGAAVVSRVGQDDLGRQVIDALRQRDIDTSCIQTDPDRDTGKVYVGTDRNGEPTYDIVRDVAWDWLQFDPDLDDLARRCTAVAFGSLAQRNAQSRNTIYRFLESSRRAIRMFDVNLRQSYYDQTTLRRSCDIATVVKLNEIELPIVARSLGIYDDDEARCAQGMIKRHELDMVVVTHGADGTALHLPDQPPVTGETASYERASDADNVGAGDACSAGILVGLALRFSPQRTVALADHAGAFVASQPGATPPLPESILSMLDG
jgi:fructokinase